MNTQETKDEILAPDAIESTPTDSIKETEQQPSGNESADVSISEEKQKELTIQEKYDLLKEDLETKLISVVITPKAFKWLFNFMDSRAKFKGVEIAFRLHEAKMELSHIRGTMEEMKLFAPGTESTAVSVKMSRELGDICYKLISQHEGEGYQAAQHILQAGLPIREALVTLNDKIEHFNKLEAELGLTPPKT